MIKNQFSTLTNEDQCKQCANCCKSLPLWVLDSEGMSDRIGFLESDIISYTRTGVFQGSLEWIILVIDSKCQHLKEDDGSYQCGIWDSEDKPRLCRSYPSNRFYNFVTNTPFTDKEYIEKTISIVSKTCPALDGKELSDISKDQAFQLLHQQTN